MSHSIIRNFWVFFSFCFLYILFCNLAVAPSPLSSLALVIKFQNEKKLYLLTILKEKLEEKNFVSFFSIRLKAYYYIIEYICMLTHEKVYFKYLQIIFLYFFFCFRYNLEENKTSIAKLIVLFFYIFVLYIGDLTTTKITKKKEKVKQ